MPELGPSPLMTGGDSLDVAAARAAIAAAIRPIDGRETLPLRQALGRVLAEDVISPIDVPAHDNSAMDGYAFAGSALADGAETMLRVAATVHAGDVPTMTTAPGDCVRIMTGAVMPPGLDTVVPQELCRLEDGRIHIAPGTLRAGDNRRLRGEDLRRGEPALQAGHILGPADLGLLASLACAEVPVRRRLRVAFFSTGDELRSIGEPLDDGCVYDSNRYTLHGMLTRLGVDLIDMGVVRDDPQALRAAFTAAARDADAVITSGGVSVGEADHTKAVMRELGEVLFWKIAMRPGRPMAIGRIDASPEASSDSHTPGAILFGLPGNPVAVMVTFYAFVREALLAMSGARAAPLPALHAVCDTPLRKKPGRTEFQRGILSPGTDGRWHVRITGAQGSGILRSMSEANALVVLGHAQGSVAAGDEVEVWLFDGLV